MIKVVTFFTHGPPQDEGARLEAQSLVIERLVRDLGHRFSAYSPQRIREVGAERLLKRYPDEYRLPNNWAANTLGFYAWKPYIILDAMKDLSDGDTLFYMDGNLEKYPAYRDKVKNIGELIEIACNVGDFFVAREITGQELTARQFSSGTQMRTIGAGTEFQKSFPVLIVNNIICRKSVESLSILHEWLEYCSREECITPPLNGDHDPEYKWFCPEQAVLNLVISRRVEAGLLPWFYPGVAIGRGFNPQLADNSHTVHLSRKLPAFASAGRPLIWETVDVRLDAWKEADDGRLTPQPDGEVLLGDGTADNYHLMRISDPGFDRCWIRLKILARPLDECDVSLHVQHWGGLNVASLDRHGALQLDSNTLSAVASPREDGYLLYEVVFPNLHSTISIGLGSPYGHYQGKGHDQYSIKNISVERAPIDATND